MWADWARLGFIIECPKERLLQHIYDKRQCVTTSGFHTRLEIRRATVGEDPLIATADRIREAECREVKKMTNKPDPSRGTDPTSPVSLIDADLTDGGSLLEHGVALCLSGGGYRAMLFHVGTLWRLNDFGYLPKINRVSSVSGGSITAGVLGLNWNRLEFNQSEVATNLTLLVVDPIRQLASITIDAESIIGGIVLPGSIAERMAAEYRKYL